VSAPGDEEIPVFRSLAAPGLEEDDIFAAMHGLPMPGPFWGQGWPAPRRDDDDRPWCEEEQRRRRHEELLRKWSDGEGPGPTA
jgi:hypothetical protein